MGIGLHHLSSPNDPVGTAIISVRHWRSGNCSQPLWRIAAVKVSSRCYNSHRPVFRLSETLKHRRTLGLRLTGNFLWPFSPLLLLPHFLSLCPFFPTSPSSPHPFLFLSLFFSSSHKTTHKYLGRKVTAASRRPGVKRRGCWDRACKGIPDKNLCKLGHRGQSRISGGIPGRERYKEKFKGTEKRDAPKDTQH